MYYRIKFHTSTRALLKNLFGAHKTFPAALVNYFFNPYYNQFYGRNLKVLNNKNNNHDKK